MEDYISEEAIFLKKAVSSIDSNSPCDLYSILIKCTCNVICAVVKGQRFDYNDPQYTEYMNLSKEFLSLIGINNPVFVFQLLKYIPGDLFGYKKVRVCVRARARERPSLYVCVCVCVRARVIIQ